MKAFRKEHLDSIDDDLPYLPSMSGITIMNDEGRIVTCGGTMICEWGYEMWIYSVNDMTPGERVGVARIARAFVSSMLDRHEEVYANAFDGNEKWLDFLGFRQIATIPCEQGITVQRWRVRVGEYEWA